MDQALKKVIWAEGVLLGQQHLQQWDNYYQTQQKILHRTIAPSAWGLITLEIDEEALLNGQIRVKHCAAIYPNGTLVQYDESEGYELNCKLQPKQGKKLTVHLCLPMNQSVAEITGYHQPQQNCTWTANYQTVTDLYDPSREREVMFGKLNLVLQQDENQDQFHSLKIAELINTGENHYHLTKDFIPTVVHIQTAPYLINMLKRLQEIITSKIRTLAAQHPTPDEAIKFLLLQILNSAYIQLQHLAKHPDTHPQQLFLTLTTLASQLSIFKENFSLTSLPSYQHANLTSGFIALNNILLNLLDVTIPTRIEPINLRRENDSLYIVDHIDSSIFERAEFFLAVYFRAENTNWIEQFARQVKVGSHAAIDQMIAAALPGIQVTHIQRPPDKLIIKPGYEYFYLEPSGNFWQQIKTDKSLAIFLPHDFVKTKIELITIPK